MKKRESKGMEDLVKTIVQGNGWWLHVDNEYQQSTNGAFIATASAKDSTTTDMGAT